MSNRRSAKRRTVDLPVTKQMGEESREGFAADLSPTGARLRRLLDREPSQGLLNLELHVVPGSLSTVVAARRVWFDDDFEGFEFISPSFSQQALLERICGNF
jgi:hypothetical protein